MTRPGLSLQLAAILAAGILLVALPSGCSKDEGPSAPVVPGPTDTIPYGGGTVSFNASGAGGAYSASGPYSPSAAFADDSASHGSGGFLHDTVSAGRPYQARLNTYIHTLRGGLLAERVLVVTLDAGGALTTGDYAVVPDDSPAAAPTARLTYLFFSDSLAEYAAYEGSSGVFTVASLDTATREIQGTFSATLRSAPPDTSLHVVVTGGSFNLKLVRRYYDY
jgi:hypothetical protein